MSVALTDSFEPMPQYSSDYDISGKNMDYSCILDQIGLQYTSIEYYWQVGALKAIQGWILDLSVIRLQLVELLHLILPILAEQGITFKIIRNDISADSLLEGKLGVEYLGKMIRIYPEDDRHAFDLANQLISITSTFKGPDIPTDRYLGGIVYTSYGIFNPKFRSGLGLEQSTYTIPFSLPKEVSWPFERLNPAYGIKRAKLLNARYYPISIIKEDTKGRVIKAIYFKGITISSCVIKEARRFVLYDDYHRDIKDRLQWQYDLYHKLSGAVPLPHVTDYFEEFGDAYLVMEFIRGISFTRVIRKAYKNGAWCELERKVQLDLVDYLLRIITVVERLHSMGYVHRDITPENFMVDKKDKLWLIDIELMFSLTDQKPVPPFAIGTPGYISPEQRHVEIPTSKEDVYAIGALILTTFTNLPPTKFDTYDSERLRSNLFFFTRDKAISNSIAECLIHKRSERSDLSKIRNALELYRDHLKEATNIFELENSELGSNINAREIWGLIEGAIQGLGRPDVMTSDLLWFSRFMKEEGVGNEQASKILFEGWQTGISGVLWLLSIAREQGFDIRKVESAYEHGWKYISRSFISLRNNNSSLYTGSAGVALALSLALKAGAVQPGSYKLSLEKCFSKDNLSLNLSDGVAGQGIALLNAAQWLSPNYVHDHLISYVYKLNSSQKRDGSWDTYSQMNGTKIDAYIFDDGVPGIIWFLLCCMEHHPSEMIRISIYRGLNWLVQKAKVSKIRVSGIPHIALVFVKAYEVLGNDLYRNIATSYLSALPMRPIFTDFTLAKGMAGIGEVYLETYRILKDAIWLERASWIAQVLMNASCAWPTGERYWSVNGESWITADLFAGNSGIIHFLMRYLLPDKIAHPLAVQ
jgi:serine/threonine protein kinase